MGNDSTLPIRTLYCSCCGAVTRGRQWHNRDIGYGLCVACIEYVGDRQTYNKFSANYGVRGIHFDVKETI